MTDNIVSLKGRFLYLKGTSDMLDGGNTFILDLNRIIYIKNDVKIINDKEVYVIEFFYDFRGLSGSTSNVNKLFELSFYEKHKRDVYFEKIVTLLTAMDVLLHPAF
ncbi:MAG: hypothetical protein JSS63_11360 [Bacteroidetes bacterium]|nr:hypothetical protein [Bacteroidota bacterium]MBX7045604.1 hypothetical protein [Ignavibacteria bacterium]